MNKQKIIDFLGLTLKTGSILAAAFYILICAFIIYNRISYPLELECGEGAMAQHAERVFEGKPIYAAPDIHFIANIYMPLYYYAGSIFFLVFGKGFFALRLLSVISTIAALLALFLTCKKLTNSTYIAFISVGMFFAAYDVCGSWFDLARVDMLFLCFILYGVYFALLPNKKHAPFLSSVMFALSFFTKQSVLPLIILLSIISLFFEKSKNKFVFGLTSLILCGTGVLLLHLTSGGWSTFYAFTIPNQHALLTDPLRTFWTKDLFGHFPILILAGVFGLFYSIDSAYQKTKYFLIVIMLIIISFMGRIFSGGFVNALLPAIAAIILAFALGLKNLFSTPRHNYIMPLIYLLIIVQFGLLKYPIRHAMPSKQQLATGVTCLRRFSQVNGNVFWSDHCYYLTLASKPSQATQSAVFDVIHYSKDSTLIRQLSLQINDQFRQGFYDAVILDKGSSYLPYLHESDRYKLIDSNYFPQNVFTLNSREQMPKYLYAKKSFIDPE